MDKPFKTFTKFSKFPVRGSPSSELGVDEGSSVVLLDVDVVDDDEEEEEEEADAFALDFEARDLAAASLESDDARLFDAALALDSLARDREDALDADCLLAIDDARERADAADADAAERADERDERDERDDASSSELLEEEDERDNEEVGDELELDFLDEVLLLPPPPALFLPRSSSSSLSIVHQVIGNTPSVKSWNS